MYGGSARMCYGTFPKKHDVLQDGEVSLLISSLSHTRVSPRSYRTKYLIVAIPHRGNFQVQVDCQSGRARAPSPITSVRLTSTPPAKATSKEYL